jgi:hypothetical protein
MTTTTEALQALVSELEAAAVYAAVSAARGTKATEANMRNLDARRAALASALAEVVKDAERYRLLRELHEDDIGESLCVFEPDLGFMCLRPVGSMPGELDATIDAALAARSAEQKGV